MDTTYASNNTTYISPDPAMAAAPDTFGDEEAFSTYEASLLLDTLPNEPLPFLAGDDVFPMPLPLDMSGTVTNASTLGTPPLSGFDGYLAGNMDFDDEHLFDADGLFWGADMYNQSFAAAAAATATGVVDGFVVPPPPSTASESQGLSPADNMFLPFTPPEDPSAAWTTAPEAALAFTPSTMPSPSSAISNPSPPPPSSFPSSERKSSASTGPKRQLRKLIRPETCPVCGKGHAQLRERDRHIVTQHYDQAVRMGLNVDRPQCALCDQTFRRKDHLTRHMKRRHGH